MSNAAQSCTASYHFWCSLFRDALQCKVYLHKYHNEVSVFNTLFSVILKSVKEWSSTSNPRVFFTKRCNTHMGR